MSGVRCGKCLLSEFDMTAFKETVADYISAIAQDNRASDSEYSRRLSVCRQCSELIDGMCGECGCFVEIRAAKLCMKCPVNKW